jgi:predicted DNA-binding transcriptional regulator YafY
MPKPQSDRATVVAAAPVLLFRQRDEQVDPRVQRVVQQALHERWVVEIDYVDSEGVGTRREVEPSGLIRGEDGWYLVGWCRLRGDGRAFRLDRVSHAVLTDQVAIVRSIRDLVPDVPPGPAPK